MENSQAFCIMTILAVVTVLLAWLACSMSVHASRLRTLGVTASGTVVKILGIGDETNAYYEFITMTSSLGKGTQRNIPGHKPYAAGDLVNITYLPDRPSISSITEHLESKIVLLKRISRTMGLTAFIAFLLLALLLFLTVKYNTIHNLF